MLVVQQPTDNNKQMNNTNGQVGRTNRLNNRNRKHNTNHTNSESGDTNSKNFKKNLFQRSGDKNFNRSRKDQIPTTSSSSGIRSNNALSANVSQFQEELEFDSIIGGFSTNHSLFQSIRRPVRQLPKFVVYQPPNIRAAPLTQDEWDAHNQTNMLNREESTSELALLYDEFCGLRDVERSTMETRGLVDKEDTRKTLEDAISFTGSCFDMCPIFERIRRSAENDVTKYEKDPMTGKIMKSKAIKAFSRPAAGQPPPLPSDVRPPQILMQTLDYIIENLLDKLPEAQPFIWDRTRSIRQDFTYQNYIGPEAIDCTERIVRIHILTLHIMAKSDVEYSQQQELEQMNKAFKTLSEMYNEFRSRGLTCPNEAEFKSYYMLSQLRDPELDREIQAFPTHLLKDPNVQLALNLRNLIQTNIVQRSFSNVENTLNFYKNFFQNLNERKLPPLFSFLLEIHLNEIRFYTIKSIKKSLGKTAKPYPISYIVTLLAFNDEQDLRQFAEYYGLNMDLESIDLLSLTHKSHLIADQKPLKQAFLLKYDSMFGSYNDLINSGVSNLDIDVGDIPDFKSTTSISASVPTSTPSSIGFSFGAQSGSSCVFGSNQKPTFGLANNASTNSSIPIFGSTNAQANTSEFGQTSSSAPVFDQTTTTTTTTSAFGETPTLSAFGKPAESTASVIGFRASPTLEPLKDTLASNGSGTFSFGTKPGSELPTKEDKEKIEREKSLKLQQEEQERKKREELQILELERRKKDEEEELKRQREAEKLQEMKQKLLMEKQKRQNKIQIIANDLSLSLYQSIVKSIVGKQTQEVLKPIMEKRQMKDDLVNAYSEGLLEAFVNELVYINTIEALADRFRENQLKKFIIENIKNTGKLLIQKQETKKRKRDEFLQVSKSFGIPSSLIKRKKSSGKLKNGNNVDLHSFQLKELMGKFDKYENYNLLVYNTNELNPTINKILKLKLPPVIEFQNKLKFHIKIIEKKIDDLNFLVNNQFVLINVESFFGACDEFNLNYLIQGLKLNSNYKVEILIVIWDIKDVADEMSIRQTIMKIFKSYMSDLIVGFKIIKISSNLNLDLIEEELSQFGDYVQLTMKGEFNISNKVGTISSSPSRPVVKTQLIDHPNILDSTKKLETKLNNERIFNHYRTHLEASPRYRKLPTLRSNIYKDSPPAPAIQINAKPSTKVQKQLRIEQPETQPTSSTKKRQELFNTPRPKSSQLLQTPSFFNDDSSATMSTFANITFDGRPHVTTPLMKKQENHSADVRMVDVDQVDESRFVDSAEYSRNLNELRELTLLVRKRNHNEK